MKRIKMAVQMCLLFYMTVIGFFNTYKIVYEAVGLPPTALGVLAVSALSTLSGFGLLCWIMRN